MRNFNAVLGNIQTVRSFTLYREGGFFMGCSCLQKPPSSPSERTYFKNDSMYAVCVFPLSIGAIGSNGVKGRQEN